MAPCPDMHLGTLAWSCEEHKCSCPCVRSCLCMHTPYQEILHAGAGDPCLLYSPLSP